MLNSSLTSNTGASIQKQNTEVAMKNVYECIQDVEERVNENCSCTQCLQSQIDEINNATEITKDTVTADNIYTDNLQSTNPIVVPGVDNDFSVAGDITANKGCFEEVSTNTLCIDNLCVDNINNGCLTLDCLCSDCITTKKVCGCEIQVCKVTAHAFFGDGQGSGSILQLSCVCGTNCVQAPKICATNCLYGNNVCISTERVNSSTINGLTLTCGNISEADAGIFKNSKQIGNQVMEVPFRDGDTVFYRYQIPKGFSGEVNLYNCDYSINILINDTRNVLVGYSTSDPSRIRGFYRNNSDERLYIEVCSACPVCWSYRTPEKKCYDFGDSALWCAYTSEDAPYVTNCVFVPVEYKSHWYLLGDNTAQSGLKICGGLGATFLEFCCAYFPGGLVLDELHVNGPSYLDGSVFVGETCHDAQLSVCTLIDANNLNVHCTANLGDRITPVTNYILSTAWEDIDYYTFDGTDYTFVGHIEAQDWIADTYYWKQELAASCVNVIGCVNVCTNGANVCGNTTQVGCYVNKDATNTECTIIRPALINLNGDNHQSAELSKNTIGVYCPSCGSSMTVDCIMHYTSPDANNTYGWNAKDNGCVEAWHNDCNDNEQHMVHYNPNELIVCKCGDLGCSKVRITADGVETPAQTVSGDLTVCGNIYQCGTSYETHAEDLYSTCDYIHLRDCAQAGLSTGCYSGVEVIKFDGTHNTAIQTDNTGIWCVGHTSGCMQPIATRSNASDLVDGAIVHWDATNKCFYTQNGLCDCSNVVYYCAECKCLYTGSNDLADGCLIKWDATNKCFVAASDTCICSCYPICVERCTDALNVEYWNLSAPGAVCSYDYTPETGALCPVCSTKIINITRECYDALPVKDDCAYYMICDEWSGGLSFNDFCAGSGIDLCRCSDGHLWVINTQNQASFVGSDYISLSTTPTGDCKIDICALPLSCFCAGNGITLACSNGEMTIASKVNTMTQAAYDAATKIADNVYITTDTCKIYYGTKLLNCSGEIGDVKMFYGSSYPDSDWLPMDGRIIPAGYDAGVAFLGGATNMPDMREYAPTMIGQNAAAFAIHDTYTVGQCKDAAVGSHGHTVTNTLGVNAGTLSVGVGTLSGSYSAEAQIETVSSDSTRICPAGEGLQYCSYLQNACRGPVVRTSLSGSVNITGSPSLSGSPALTGAVSVNQNSTSVVNRGRRMGLLFVMKMR